MQPIPNVKTQIMWHSQCHF